MAQLGAMVMQDTKSLAFYSCKLSNGQSNDRRERITVCCRNQEFQNILLGQQIVIHTDHKKIIYGNLSKDRIAWWRLLLEEYGPAYMFILQANKT